MCSRRNQSPCPIDLTRVLRKTFGTSVSGSLNKIILHTAMQHRLFGGVHRKASQVGHSWHTVPSWESGSAIESIVKETLQSSEPAGSLAGPTAQGFPVFHHWFAERNIGEWRQEICFDKHVFNVVLVKLVHTSFCNSLDVFSGCILWMHRNASCCL